MSTRSLSYWLICSVFAVLVTTVAGPLVATDASVQTAMLPLHPDAGRSLLLFIGVMAMAFTYRKAWLAWKQAPEA